MSLTMQTPVAINSMSILTACSIAEPDASQGEVEFNGATYYGVGDYVILAATHRKYLSLRGLRRTASSVTAGTPCVVTCAGHGLPADTPIRFTSGTPPTGLSLNTTYYVRNPTTGTFNLALTAGGANHNTTGSTGTNLAFIEAVNVGKTPNLNTDFWKDAGPTNKWAALDDALNTKSVATSSIVWTLAPGLVSSLALFGLVGNTVRVEVFTTSPAVTYLDVTLSLDGSEVSDWYDWFYAPVIQLAKIWQDLPLIGEATVKITLSGTGTVECSHLSVGLTQEIGDMQTGTPFGIDDYSKFITDANTGVTTLVEGNYSETFEAKVWVDNLKNNQISMALKNNRAKMRVFNGVPDSNNYEALLVFGFIESWKGEPEDSFVEYNMRFKSGAIS